MKRFDSHKWINQLKSGKVLNESPADDAILKKLRIQVPGEEFPDLNMWWEYEPEDIMTYVYWHQGQLPPTGPAFEKEWNSVVKQLHVRYPIPAEELDRVLPQMDLDDRTEREISVDAPDRYSEVTNLARTGKPIKGFQPGDKWSDDFDYVGMLKWGVDANVETMDIHELEAGFESFQDVNYHTEGGHLGNAIDWMEGAVTEREHNKVEEFMSDFNSACAKTLKEIKRK